MLAIGSSSTVGVGASSPIATYIARLETTLEGSLRGMEVDVVGRGMSGEAQSHARDEVEETRPDLVVWQVGYQRCPAARCRVDRFRKGYLNRPWRIKENKIDVVLVDPQYGKRAFER